jgi:hypothetical protein
MKAGWIVAAKAAKKRGAGARNPQISADSHQFGSIRHTPMAAR